MSLVKGKTERVALCVFWGTFVFVIIYGVANLNPPKLPAQSVGEQLSALEAKVDLLELERTALIGAIQAHQDQNTLMEQDLVDCHLAASRTEGEEQLP